MEAVWIAIATIVGGIVTLVITGWQTTRAKKLDWARQDEVAARVAEATAAQAKSNEQTNKKLDVIHTLVNSNMTAAMESELAMARALLVQLQKDSAPEDETKAAIASLESRIGLLEHDLADRSVAQAQANAELALPKQ